MSISRRKFLQTGALVAVAAGIPLKTGVRAITKTQGATAQPALSGGALPAPAAIKGNAFSSYTKATFAAQLNSTFQIRSKKTRSLEVKLIEVSTVGPVPDNSMPGKECFALVFRTRQKLPQDIYSMRHAALGQFDLLLVPTGKDKKGFHYEAVINRLN